MAGGWNEGYWGENLWGEQNDVSPSVTGSRLNTSVSSVTTQAGASASPTGIQIKGSIGTAQIRFDVDVPVTGSRLNVYVGNETAKTDVSISVTTAGRLNTNIGTVTVEAIIGEGWGGDAWGLGNWGQGYTDITVNATGQRLNVLQGSTVVVPSKEVAVTGSRINVHVGSVTNTANANVISV